MDMSPFWQNLWSGAMGAVIGAAVSVLILLMTNAYTRRENEKALRQGERHFEQQLGSEREMTREQRELDVVAELLTYLQTSFDRDPTNPDLIPDLMAITNRLVLNSRENVADGWRERAGRSDHVPVRVERHPLAHALVPWVTAVHLTRTFPSTFEPAYSEDLEEREGLIQTAILGATGLDQATSTMRVHVEKVVRRMLRWSSLGDSDKIGLFDELIETAGRATRLVVPAIDVALGGGGRESVHRPHTVLVGYPEVVIVKELFKNDDYLEAVAEVRTRLSEDYILPGLEPAGPCDRITVVPSADPWLPAQVIREFFPADAF